MDRCRPQCLRWAHLLAHQGPPPAPPTAVVRCSPASQCQRAGSDAFLSRYGKLREEISSPRFWQDVGRSIRSDPAFPLAPRCFSSKSDRGDGNSVKETSRRHAPSNGSLSPSTGLIGGTEVDHQDGQATVDASNYAQQGPASPSIPGAGVSEGVTEAGGDTGEGNAEGGGGGSLPHQVSELYAEMERSLMSKMHAQDKKRFRAIGLSSVLVLVWVLSMFGTEIRRYFASQTAEVARETLKVEALQVQTQQLATALVQALLNDQEVVRAGSLFLREASADPETQAALVNLALFVLQHPDTLAETEVLARKLVKSIVDDADTVQQVTAMALNVLAKPRLRQGASELVVELAQSKEVYMAFTELCSRAVQDLHVQETLSEVLSISSHEVLEDQDLLDHSKEFVAQVIADDVIQRSGGDALWNSVHYALQTRIVKTTGLCLVAASVAMLFGLRGRSAGRSGGQS